MHKGREKEERGERQRSSGNVAKGNNTGRYKTPVP